MKRLQLKNKLKDIKINSLDRKYPDQKIKFLSDWVKEDQEFLAYLGNLMCKKHHRVGMQRRDIINTMTQMEGQISDNEQELRQLYAYKRARHAYGIKNKRESIQANPD